MDDLQRKIDKDQDELLKLKSLKELYPDLEIVHDRWRNRYLSSKMVNAIAEKANIKHGCGCCQDSVLKLYPYTETVYGNVYTDPFEIVIGSGTFSGYDEPNHDVFTKLKELSLSKTILDQVYKHFLDSLTDHISSLREDVVRAEQDLEQLKIAGRAALVYIGYGNMKVYI